MWLLVSSGERIRACGGKLYWPPQPGLPDVPALQKHTGIRVQCKLKNPKRRWGPGRGHRGRLGRQRFQVNLLTPIVQSHSTGCLLFVKGQRVRTFSSMGHSRVTITQSTPARGPGQPHATHSHTHHAWQSCVPVRHSQHRLGSGPSSCGLQPLVQEDRSLHAKMEPSPSCFLTDLIHLCLHLQQAFAVVF